MRRISRVALVLVLVLFGVVGLLPGVVSAQDGNSDLKPSPGGTPGEIGETKAEGIKVAPVSSSTDQSRELSVVTFEQGGYTIDDSAPSLLVAKVLSGSFAFRVQGPVLIDPQGEDIEVLQAHPGFGVGVEPPPGNFFEPVGRIVFDHCPVAGPPGQPTTLCQIDPDIVAKEAGVDANKTNLFVRLVIGDTVVIPPNVQCFFCNVTGIENSPATPAATATASADDAQLLVWTEAGFDWGAFANGQLGNPATPTPSAQAPGGLRAIHMHPGSPCH